MPVTVPERLNMARPKLKKDDKFQPSGEVQRIISLGGGRWAYLKNSLGKTLRMKRNSEEFIAACVKEDEILSGKIRRDLESLGWEDVLEKMNDYSQGSEVAESV